MHHRFHVITGGPGSGKSTLAGALAARGLRTMPEAGRAIIRDQVAIGGTALPWRDPALFAELMLAWELRSWTMASQAEAPVIFDRAIPDVAGYLQLSGHEVPAHVAAAARAFRYARRVFIAPHWPEIYRTDSERRQSADEAERTCRTLAASYEALGYELVPLPLAPPDERAAFVLQQIGGP